VQKSKYVATKSELAKRLGITPWTLNHNWNRPGRPVDHSDGKARYDIEKYQSWKRSWISGHNAGTGHNNNGNGKHETPFNAKELASIQKKNIDIESAQFDLDVRKGRYELKSKARDAVLRNVGIMFRELDKSMRHELPPRLEGCTATEIAKLIGNKLDTARERIDKAFKDEIASVSPTLAT